MQCHYNVLIFSKIIMKDIPQLALWGEIWGVFYRYKLTFIFCPSHCSGEYNIMFYPVHGANLTIIQPMWSAYPYAPTSLYGIHMPLLPYMVIQPIVLGMALLWAAIDSALSQGPLLWRHNDKTVIVSRNTRWRERDTRQRLNNANARRLQTVNR